MNIKRTSQRLQFFQKKPLSFIGKCPPPPTLSLNFGAITPPPRHTERGKISLYPRYYTEWSADIPDQFTQIQI